MNSQYYHTELGGGAPERPHRPPQPGEDQPADEPVHEAHSIPVEVPGTPDPPTPSEEPTEPLLEGPPQPVLLEIPKKSHKGRKVFLIVLIIVLLVVLGAGTAYLLANPKKVASPKTPTNSTQAKTTTSTVPNSPITDPQQLIADLQQTVVAGTTTEAAKYTVSNGTDAPAFLPNTPNPSYRITGNLGFSFTFEGSTQPNNFPSDTENQALSDKTLQIASDYLTGKGFSKTSSSDTSVEFQNDTLVCSVGIDPGNPGVSCAAQSAYTQLANQIAPLANAYINQGAASANNFTPVFNSPTITTSKSSANYQTASVNVFGYGAVVGGFEGLFYSVNGTWHYFTGTQDELTCSAYNTHDLQVAFEGTQCADADGTTESTVQVTLN